jgi:shikimate dehydrogenase
MIPASMTSSMLVGQAALAFEMFYGVAPPGDADEELRALLLK